MGLLGNSWDDPQTQAIMALAGGLLSANGSQGLGAGLLGAGQAYQGAQDAAMKRKLSAAQLDDVASQAELRKAQVADLLQNQSLLAEILRRRGGGVPDAGQASQGMPQGAPVGGGMPASGGAPAIGGQPTVGGAGAVPGRGTVPGGFTLDDVEALKLAKRGDFLDTFKARTQPIQLGNGWIQNPDNSREYVGDPSKGIMFNSAGTQAAPILGYAGANADIQGAATEAQRRAENRNTLAPNDRINPVTNRPYAMTVDGLIQSIASGAASADSPIGAFSNRNADGSSATPASILAGVNQIRDPQERARALQALQGQTGAGGFAGFAGPGEIKSGELRAVEAAQKVRDLNSAIAGKEAGTLDDLSTKAQAAKTALPMIWQAQDLLKAGTFTGMGSDQKMAVVRALSAMGFPVPDSVANSQSFDATLSRIVGANIKAQVGSNGISNADVKFVQQQFGQRGQEAQAIKYILDKAEQSNHSQISSYNDLLSRATDNGAISSLGKVDAPAKPGAPTKVSNNAEYDALPSGTQFIDPFGKVRRKP